MTSRGGSLREKVGFGRGEFRKLGPQVVLLLRPLVFEHEQVVVEKVVVPALWRVNGRATVGLGDVMAVAGPLEQAVDRLQELKSFTCGIKTRLFSDYW